MSWLDRGWQVFDAEPDVTRWLDVVGPEALRIGEGARRNGDLRHGGTWFVGVDALPNGADGAVAGGPPLAGCALSTARGVTGDLPLHRAQVSVTFPGYPRRDPDESDASHRFRLRRDAAHLDGLLPIGPDRRRHLREPHAFILGIAATPAPPDAAPLVVWEKSHHLIREAFAAAYEGVPPEAWRDVDVTDVYTNVRRAVFERCPRRAVSLGRGQSVLLHRLAIHGVAPWGAGTAQSARAILYFRPRLSDPAQWLGLP